LTESKQQRSAPPAGALAPADQARFEQDVLAHLDAAFRLARHLLRDMHEAEDAVQESVMRAIRYFPGYRGTNGRAWLLAIVRNTCFTLRKRNWLRLGLEFDEELHTTEETTPEPQRAAERRSTSEAIERALLELPLQLREVVVLRELEQLSYKEIAFVAHVPIGTVMSRLARARVRLERALLGRDGERP
jgi:RNA polymerase sigma-70 factor (ECF subfamily)